MKKIPDKAVVEFLRIHGIECRPPQEESAASRALGGAITGSLGIVAGAAVHFDKQLRGNAANSEWISWKQWALSHVEWNQWWQANQQTFLLQAAQEEESARLKSEARKRARERDRSAGIRLILFTCLLFASLAVVGAGNYVLMRLRCDSGNQDACQQLSSP